MKEVLYRRFRYGEPVIVVSGCLAREPPWRCRCWPRPRASSAVTDGVREAGEDNPKGYFEDERVKDLHKNGVDRSLAPGRTWHARSKSSRFC